MSKYKCCKCGYEAFVYFSYEVNGVLCYRCNQDMIKENKKNDNKNN